MPDLLPEDERALSRRERERLRRRRSMLRAAQAVFAEKGYAGATLDEIAERAEFGKGTLYNYFEGGKEEILYAVFDRIFDHIQELLRDAFGASGSDAPENGAPSSLRDCYHAFVVTYVSFFQERQDLFMVLVKEVHRSFFSSDTERAHYFKRQRERLTDVLVVALEEAHRTGEIRDLPVQTVAHMLLGNTQRMQLACAMERSGAPLPKGAPFAKEEMGDAAGEACEETPIHDPHRAADFLTTVLFDGLTEHQ